MTQSMFLRSASRLASVLTLCLAPAAWAAPQWIWAPKTSDDQTVLFRHSFNLEKVPAAARLALSCDNKAEIWVNGQPVGKTSDWNEPARRNVQKFLRLGKNVIAVKASNEGGVAALVARLGAGPEQVLAESGPAWKQSSEAAPGWETPGFDDSTWTESAVVANLGDGPWGNVFARPADANGQASVAPPESLTLPKGFKAELLYNVPKSEQGSWVSLTLDDKQRLIAGDQDGGLYRITLKDGAEPDVRRLQTKVEMAQGLLYANGALYFMRNGGDSGLYRLRDTNGDDEFDEETLLRKLDGGGEHGPHAIVLAPDGKSLYVVAGNFTALPNPESSRVPKLWGEDQLIPRMTDAGGHDPHIMAPAGWVARTDFDGKQWELISMGFRNTYDIAFSREGELFGFDSDMEWDIGMPWYRPTRVVASVPGAEFGFRNGSGKFPTYYPDSLPPVLNIGPGSPTGVFFGYGAKFPAKYENAFYIMDWTYGTMYAIHLTPSGAGWKAEKEEFVSGKPLPLTDGLIRPADGAMYFLVGGRKTQSGLYRVTYTGTVDAPAPAFAPTPELTLRRELEALQSSPPSEVTLNKAWPALNHPDRFVRFAARSVIEFQPVDSWRQRALNEESIDGSLTALLALSRAGQKQDLHPLLHSMARLNWSSLSEEQKLSALRVAGVAFIRMGLPDDETRTAILAKLDPLFPSTSPELNKELCNLLVALGSSQVVPKAVQLISSVTDDAQSDIGEKSLLDRSESYAKGVLSAQQSRPNRAQINYGFALRVAKNGWSPELYRQYFRWFNTARKFDGGNSVKGFIENMRKEALANAPENLRGELDKMSGELLTVSAELPQPIGPGRVWTMEELLALTKDGLHGRDFDKGHTAFKAALCSSCHRFGSEGGGVGPDITGSGNRYTMKDVLENILEPSKVISDQYESTLIEKHDGTSLVGRVLKEEGDIVFVAENPLAPAEATTVNQSNIKSREKYPVSAMPPALLNNLNQDEVLDLLAYLMSGGNREDKAFKK